MKVFSALIPILLALPLAANAAQTRAATLPVDALRQIARNCAVQPYALNRSGGRVHGPLRSVCPELAVDGARAEFRLQTGATYVVTLADSEDSDGGDLDDVTIAPAQQGSTEGVSGDEIVQRNVLAFGDPVLAILGGASEGLPEVLDPSLIRN